jgi:UrcA family protein
MSLFRTRLARAAAPLVAVCGLLPALALASPFPNDDVRTARVRFGDLDLNSPAGAERLYRRLSIASRDVCGDSSEIIALEELADIRACRNEALEDAVARVDRPLLTAAYEHHHPGQVLVSENRTPRNIDVSVSYQ